MVGPLLERLGLDLVDHLLDARRHLPRPRAQPAAGGEPPLHHRQGASRRAPTSGSPGTATPTAASSSTTPAAFVDGDFLTALLAESMLAKQPGADILYDVRASRAVPDVVAAPAARAHVNRVGHAFFKTRMRDEGGAFGGEVSGHYYFRDFYNADSRHDPGAADPRAALDAGQDAVASCSSRCARRYFISGEINSEVADAAGRRWPRSRSATRDGEITHARRRLGRLRRLALQRAPVQHRAAAAAQPRDRSSRSEDMERRRDEVLALIRVVSTGSLGAQRRRRRDPRLAIPTPFAVGRVNCYLIEDDPLTLVDAGPNSGKALDALERALARARATASRTSSGSSSPTSTSTTSGWSGILAAALRRRGRRARPARAGDRGLRRRRGARRRAGRGADAAPRDPARRRHRAARRVALVPRLGRLGARSPAGSPTARRSSSRDRTLDVLHRPGPLAVGHRLLGRASAASCSAATT